MLTHIKILLPSFVWIGGGEIRKKIIKAIKMIIVDTYCYYKVVNKIKVKGVAKVA